VRRLLIPALAPLVACALFVSPDGRTVPPGTWGGDNAGLIVTDTGAHLHIGCTVGNVRAAIPVDEHGRFDVAGSHNITAHPVDLGVFLPARLTGRLDVTLRALTLTVTVDDTVRHETVVLGPVRLRWGATPVMGPCPICRTPPE
jgi:hypothetical protein